MKLCKYSMFGQDWGYVLSFKDTIANAAGLRSVQSGEMVASRAGHIGLVLNLEIEQTGVVMFKDNILKEGDKLVRLREALNIHTEPTMLSNVFDTLGKKLNHINTLNSENLSFTSTLFGNITRMVELKAPGIINRQPVYESVVTGILGVDAVLPLGQGQRELIIGDRQTGKTTIAVDSILSSSNIDVHSSRYALPLKNLLKT